ncbi:hypothetical protein [Vibrio kagoshimensis]
MSPLDIEYLASTLVGALGLGWVLGKQFLTFKQAIEVSTHG